MNILGSFVFKNYFYQFLITSLVFFFDLYLVILKILHKIGINHYFEINQESPHLARKYIIMMQIKIYIIIIIGYLFELKNFPNKFFIFSIPFYFGLQLLQIAY